MEDLIKKREDWMTQGNLRLKIVCDEDVDNPRQERYNLGKIYFPEVSRYSGINESPELKSMVEESDNLEELLITAKKTGWIILPVYMLDHSGVSFSCDSFNDPWDSGLRGVIGVSPEDIRKAYGGIRRVTKKCRDAAERVLRAEIETLNMWSHGDVYGVIVENESTGETVDSVWGVYGWEYALETGRDMMEYSVCNA